MQRSWILGLTVAGVAGTGTVILRRARGIIPGCKASGRHLNDRGAFCVRGGSEQKHRQCDSSQSAIHSYPLGFDAIN